MRFLIIPHAPATPLRTRAAELARSLARLGHSVDLYTRNLQPPGLSTIGKAKWHLGESLSGIRLREVEPRIRAILPPTFHRGRGLANFADWISAQALALGGYDAIVSSAYGGLEFSRRAARLGALIRGKGPLLIYDYVDDHAAGSRHAGRSIEAESIERFVARQVRSADQVMTSGIVLAEKILQEHGVSPIIVPNGAHVSAIRVFANSAPGTDPKKVIYVGGLEDFVRIDWVVEALSRLREESGDLELTIVGEGPAIRGRSFPSWVNLAGFKSPEKIPSLLGAAHLGVVPFEKSPFTDAALPLKVLEYGAARLVCVSSPLEELKRHDFPWVLTASDGASWYEALKKGLLRTWEPAWDAIVDGFDWDVGARKLLSVCYSRRARNSSI